MTGKLIRNRVLVAPIEREARALGATVYSEYRVVTPTLDGYVDLLVRRHSLSIVYQAERSLDCVPWVIMKAIALKADQLQIIFPNGRLARAAQMCVDKLKASGKAANLPIFCLTLGAALQRLKDRNGFDFGLNVPPTLRHHNSPANPRNNLPASSEQKDESCKPAGTTSSR